VNTITRGKVKARTRAKKSRTPSASLGSDRQPSMVRELGIGLSEAELDAPRTLRDGKKIGPIKTRGKVDDIHVMTLRDGTVIPSIESHEKSEEAVEDGDEPIEEGIQLRDGKVLPGGSLPAHKRNLSMDNP